MTPGAVAALLPVLGYALVSIFTPGPNNVTSSSIGMRAGYGRAVRFITGVFTGFFVVMTLAGLLTEALVAAVQRAEVVLRILGVAYLLWLAWTVVKPRQSEATSGASARFIDGFLLQFVNVKVILFGITMYGTLLTPWVRSPRAVLLSALGLSFLSFCSTSLWALLGAVIQRFIANPRVRFAYSLVMVILLLSAAWSVAFS